MAAKLDAKTTAKAKSLMEKHNKEVIFVNSKSGHMHFNKAAALLGAKDKDLIVEVKNSTSKEDEKQATTPKS